MAISTFALCLVPKPPKKRNAIEFIYMEEEEKEIKKDGETDGWKWILFEVDELASPPESNP